MKIAGKSLTFNGKNIYHEGNKPIASDILFTDGKTLQQKLDDGSLKGDKGDTGTFDSTTIFDTLNTSNKTVIGAINELLALINKDGDNGGETTIPVEGITVDDWNVSLTVGQTRQMIASVVPSNATNKLIHWYSDYPYVATVNSTGLITAMNSGYAKITATTDEGGYKYDIHVNVSAKEETNPSPETGLTVNSSYTIKPTEMLEISYTTSIDIPSSCAWELRQNGTYLCSAYRDTSTGKIVCYTGGLSVGTHNNITLVVKEYQTDIAVSNVFSITVSDSSSSGGGGSEGGGGSGGANIYLEPSSLVFNSGTQYESKYFNVIGVSESDNVTFETNNSLVCNVRKLAYNRCEVIALANGSTNVSATFGSNKLDCYVSISNMGSDSNVEVPISLPSRIDTVAWHNQTFYISYSTNKEATLHYLDKNDGRGYVRVYPTNSYTNYSLQVDPITTTEPTHSWKLKVTDNRGNETVSTVAITVMGLPTDGGSTPPSNGDNNPISNEYELSCTSEYILDKMYPMGQSHEAIPNGNITVPDGQVNWKYKSRWENQDRPYAMSHSCGQSGCPVTGAFQALGCWSNIYRVEGTPFTQNTGVEMKDIKVYGWYNGQWELIQHLPVPNGNFYAESFNGDTNRYFGDSVKQSSTSKTIILREANKINSENCMYHPFSNVKAFDVKYQYIYTCIDLRKVKWDENGIDDRDQTHYCSNCGGDWWLKEGLMFHDSWQHNKGVAQPKIIEITNEWRRFSMTTVPQGWSNGFPTGV